MSLESLTARRAELQRLYDKRKDVPGWRQSALAIKGQITQLDADIAKLTEPPPSE